MSQEPKSGAEISAQATERKKLVEAIAKEIKLRQWCVERSLDSQAPQDVPGLAGAIYKFVTDV